MKKVEWSKRREAYSIRFKQIYICIYIILNIYMNQIGEKDP